MIPVNIVSLASIFGRGFDNWWRNTFSNPESNVFDILGDSAGVVGILVTVIISTIIIARTIKSQTSYVRPSGHLGIYSFQFSNKRFTAYVNKNEDIINTDTLDRLARRMGNEFVMPVEELKNWIRDGYFYVYDANIIKKFRNQLEGKNKAIILSPVPIEDNSVSEEDSKGEFSLIGTSREMFRIFPRNVLLSRLSKIISDDDYYGEKVNVFIIAPYVDSGSKRYRLDDKAGKIVESPIIGKSANLNVISFPPKYYESLARLASKIATFSDLEHDLTTMKDALKDQKEVNRTQSKEIVAKQVENQQLVNMTKIHAFIKGGVTYIPVTPQSFAMIAVVSAIAGFISHAISGLPYFKALQGLEYMFLIATIVVLLVIVMRKKPATQPQQTNYTQ